MDVVDGKQVEKTIAETKLVDEWVMKSSDSAWGKISVDPIEVNPQKAKLEINFSKKEYIENRNLFDHTYHELSADDVSPQIGDKRLTITYLPLEQNMIVIGDLSQNSIRSGDVFILTNRYAAGLVSTLQKTEDTNNMVLNNLVLKAFAFILFFLSILRFKQPILETIDIIPVVGKAASTVISAIGGVIFVLILLIISVVVFLNYWFTYLIMCVFILAIVIFIVYKDKINARYKSQTTKAKSVVGGRTATEKQKKEKPKT